MHLLGDFKDNGFDEKTVADSERCELWLWGVCVLVELWDLHGDSSWQLPLLPCVPSTASMCPSALCHPCGAAGESLVSPGRGVRTVGRLTEIPAFNSVTIPSVGETRRGARFRPQMHPLGSLSAWHLVCVSCPCPLSVMSPGDWGLGDLSLPAHTKMHHGAVAGWDQGWEWDKPQLGDLGTNPKMNPGFGAWEPSRGIAPWRTRP